MKVHNLINYVKQHNSFYKKYYKGKKQFHHLPFLDKQKLLQAFDGNVTRLYSHNINTGIFTRVTSGTSNMMGMFNHSDTEIEASAKRFFGVSYYLNKKERDRVCIIHNYSLSYIFTRHMLMCGCFVSLGNPYDIDYTLEHIKRTDSNVIRTSPTLAIKLAPKLKEMGHNVDVWILAGSGLSKVADKKIREHSKKGVKIIMQYGMAETLNSMYQPPGISGNDFCLFDNGDFIYEFLDEHNNEIKPGESGELIITRLSRDNPIIRYRTGDLFIKTTRKNKYGGRVYSIVGRVKDQIKINGVSVFQDKLDDAISHIADYIDGDYQLEFDEIEEENTIKSTLTLYIKKSDESILETKIADIFQTHFYIAEGMTWKQGVDAGYYKPAIIKEKKFKNINKQKQIIDKRLKQ